MITGPMGRMVLATPLVLVVALGIGTRTESNAAESPNAFRVLVFSRTLGYRHASITNGIAAIRALGARQRFQVEATEDSAAFSTANLARHRVVVFLSVTGDVLNEEQEAALTNFVFTGGGFVAIHGGVFGPSACEDKWTWYGEMFCCAFTNHSRIVNATIHVEDRTHPSTRGLPSQWQREDEWYNFTGNPRGCARVLAALDENSYVGGTMGADHPIAWHRPMGKGQMWYTAMGHTEASFSEPFFLEHILGGIRSVAGQPNTSP